MDKIEILIAHKVVRHLKRLHYLPRGTRWNVDDTAAYIAWRRSKIEELPGGERQFLIEYPENDKDCFEQTGRPLVSAQYLVVSCKPAEPVENHEYLIAVDVSLGLQSGDPAAIQILDLATGRQVFQESIKIPPDLLAYRLAELSDQYNWAKIVVERNGPGIATILKLQELGYEDRLYKHLDARLRRAIEDGDKSVDEAMDEAQYGFPTSTDTKPLIGLALERGIRTGEMGISYQSFCDEARTVVWFDDKSWGAMPGYLDDLCVALAIGCYVMMTANMSSGFVGVMPETGHAR